MASLSVVAVYGQEDSTAINLSELVVTNRKVDKGVFVYNMAVLSDKHIVENVFESIRLLPGISYQNDGFVMDGISGVAVLVNGKQLFQSTDQLLTYLKSLSVSQVSKIEVMRSAPPRYHVRGAVVNIILKNGYGQLQGEAHIAYCNQFFSDGKAGISLRGGTEKISVRGLYEGGCERDLTYLEMDSHHFGQDIEYDQLLVNKGSYHTAGIDFDFGFEKFGDLQLSYLGFYQPSSKGYNKTIGNVVNSEVRQEEEASSHHFSFSFKDKKDLSLMVDYTRYHLDGGTDFINQFTSDYGQHIRRWSLYTDKSMHIGESKTLDYGLSFVDVKDKDSQIYHVVVGDRSYPDVHSKMHETTFSGYLQHTGQYKGKLSYSLSLTGEYYGRTGYHKWSLYPQFSANYYMPNDDVLILSLSSDKTYPSYWMMQTYETFLDAYSVERGRSDLHPSSQMKFSSTYLLRQKYYLTGFVEHHRSYFSQTAHQAEDRLALIYETFNWKYLLQYGFSAYAALSFGEKLNLDLNAVLVNSDQKNTDSSTVPFDRSKVIGMLTANAVYRFNDALSVELDNMYVSPSISGIYDLCQTYQMDFRVRYNLLKGKLRLGLSVSDVFNTGQPKVKVHQSGQHFDFDISSYQRMLKLSLVYNFNDYKVKSKRKIDDSRFGHQRK